jgi:hypothetical protein
LASFFFITTITTTTPCAAAITIAVAVAMQLRCCYYISVVPGCFAGNIGARLSKFFSTYKI